MRSSRRAGWIAGIAAAIACVAVACAGAGVTDRVTTAESARPRGSEPAADRELTADREPTGEPSPTAAAPTEAVPTEAVTGPTLPSGAAGEVATAAGTTETAEVTETVTAAALDPLLASGSLSTSIGGPADGRLEGGIPLPASGPGYRSNPARPNSDAFYGTVETIRALVRAAAVVHEQMPGSELVINDIGLPQGGPIPHHGSHRAGRDVDVLFYYFDREGSSWPAKGVPVDPRGRGWDFGDLADPRDDVRVRLDVPRTWRFVQALIESEEPSAPLQRIFLAEHVRALLLEHAERARAPRGVRDRFGDLTCQPGYPHDDHLHLRFFCSAEDVRAGCMDGAPMYPWRRQQLVAEGVDAVMARPRPRGPRARAPRDEVEGAEGEGGTAAPLRMHARVRAFLDERATWSVQPHPGRRYCR